MAALVLAPLDSLRASNSQRPPGPKAQVCFPHSRPLRYRAIDTQQPCQNWISLVFSLCRASCLVFLLSGRPPKGGPHNVNTACGGQDQLPLAASIVMFVEEAGERTGYRKRKSKEKIEHELTLTSAEINTPDQRVEFGHNSPGRYPVMVWGTTRVAN